MTDEAQPDPQAEKPADSGNGRAQAEPPSDRTERKGRDTTNLVIAVATVVTAIATAAIAWWTWSYVTYSEQQWKAVQDTNRIAWWNRQVRPPGPTM